MNLRWPTVELKSSQLSRFRLDNSLSLFPTIVYLFRTQIDRPTTSERQLGTSSRGSFVRFRLTQSGPKDFVCRSNRGATPCTYNHREVFLDLFILFIQTPIP